MKNFLVTGGAGFIGSHLCEKLHSSFGGTIAYSMHNLDLWEDDSV